jgi:tricorn protease
MLYVSAKAQQDGLMPLGGITHARSGTRGFGEKNLNRAMDARQTSGGGKSQVGVLRYPDVSATQIAFIFAGEVWLVPREGGLAAPLTRKSGPKFSPKFAPDGQTIAFTGDYDGIYTIRVAGGSVFRVTHHPGATNLCDWTQDARLLFMTDAFSFAANFDGQARIRQLFTVPATGGLPEKVRVPYGANGAISPDGQWLAYTLYAEGQREHKSRYQGGLAPDIWLLNLRNYQARKITDWDGTDSAPMWHGETIYYLSDAGRERRLNIWCYELATGRRQQLTKFDDYDVKWPSVGPGPRGEGELVFVKGSDLYLLALSRNKAHKVSVALPEDRFELRPRTLDASKFVTNWNISPDGRHVVAVARGDLWTIPADKGTPRNLTGTSGAFERDPSWSPDGRWVAYTSDARGDYQLFIVSRDGAATPRQLSRLGPGYRFQPIWSPDSRRIAFSDSSGSIYLHTLGNSETKQVRQDPLVRQPHLSWSPDSSWLAFSGGANDGQAIWLYSVETGDAHQVTSGGYNDRSPTFDRKGDYLFFVSNRNFDPLAYDSTDYNNFTYPTTDLVIAVPLRRGLGPPWKSGSDSRSKTPEGPTKSFVIDFEEFERRAVVAASEKGSYSNLAVTDDGELIYAFTPQENGPSIPGDSPPSIKMLNFTGGSDSGRKSKTVLSRASAFRLSDDGKKVLVRVGDTMAIVDAAPGQKLDAQISMSGMTVEIEPRDEWRQIFNDAWRLYRDFFYDPAMRGVDWSAMREKYGRLLAACANREDVDYVIGEMLGELSSSHVYLNSPPKQQLPPEEVGMLGVDFELAQGAYRIVKIYDAAPSDVSARNPLRQPGVDVKEGDYLLAVNGRPLDTKQDPWAAFKGTAGKVVTLSVSRKPVLDRETREVVVQPFYFDSFYRLRAWIEANRAYVERKTSGKVGYLFLPVTSEYGFREFTRQFGPQLGKEAMIIDVRWNQGGHIPFHLIDILSRQIYFYSVDQRQGVSQRNPGYLHEGPRCILINEITMSGGDLLSYMARKSNVGKLIGRRTMGAMVGAGGINIPFIDGGFSVVPTVGFYDSSRRWIVEGRGVEPQLDVLDDPGLMIKGGDPQLDAAIQQMMNELRQRPPTPKVQPPFRDSPLKTP